MLKLENWEKNQIIRKVIVATLIETGELEEVAHAQ